MIEVGSIYGTIFVILLIIALLVGIISAFGKRKGKYGGFLTLLAGSTIELRPKHEREAMKEIIQEKSDNKLEEQSSGEPKNYSTKV